MDKLSIFTMNEVLDEFHVRAADAGST